VIGDAKGELVAGGSGMMMQLGPIVHLAQAGRRVVVDSLLEGAFPLDNWLPVLLSAFDIARDVVVVPRVLLGARRLASLLSSAVAVDDILCAGVGRS
jgi:hypothetical protein